MATLTIRNLEAAVKERLRVRAARHGRSMEPNCVRSSARPSGLIAISPSRTWPRRSAGASRRSAGSISNRIRRRRSARRPLSIRDRSRHQCDECATASCGPRLGRGAAPRACIRNQAEILYGIAAQGRRRTALAAAAEAMFAEDFAGEHPTVQATAACTCRHRSRRLLNPIERVRTR